MGFVSYVFIGPTNVTVLLKHTSPNLSAVMNFLVYYAMDKTTGTHALTPTTYNNLLDARAPTNNWVLLHRPP